MIEVKVILSYEATKAVATKAQKNIWGFNGIWTHQWPPGYWCDVLAGQLSYEALLEACPERVHFIPVWHKSYLWSANINNCG